MSAAWAMIRALGLRSDTGAGGVGVDAAILDREGES